MAGFVESTVKDIDTRLAELKEELTRLEAARSALVSGATSRSASSGGGSATSRRRGPGRPPASASRTTRRPGRPRGRRGGNTRAKEALELVRTRPGVTIPQIAEELKILPNYLYRVMPKLVADGQIKRDGQGWYPIG
jgi:hypothetical protein